MEKQFFPRFLSWLCGFWGHWRRTGEEKERCNCWKEYCRAILSTHDNTPDILRKFVIQILYLFSFFFCAEQHNSYNTFSFWWLPWPHARETIPEVLVHETWRSMLQKAIYAKLLGDLAHCLLGFYENVQEKRKLFRPHFTWESPSVLLLYQNTGEFINWLPQSRRNLLFNELPWCKINPLQHHQMPNYAPRTFVYLNRSQWFWEN